MLLGTGLFTPQLFTECLPCAWLSLGCQGFGDTLCPIPKLIPASEGGVPGTSEHARMLSEGEALWRAEDIVWRLAWVPGGNSSLDAGCLCLPWAGPPRTALPSSFPPSFVALKRELTAVLFASAAAGKALRSFLRPFLRRPQVSAAP